MDTSYRIKLDQIMCLYIPSDEVAAILIAWSHFSETELKDLYFLIRRNPQLIPHLADLHARQVDLAVRYESQKLADYKKSVYALLEAIQESGAMPKLA